MFCSEGYIMEVLVTISQDKATPNANGIQSFEAKHQLTLPDNYQKFITLHNGALLMGRI